jgi:hypothetical protein
MGLGSFVKHSAPLGLYGSGFLCVFMAMIGNVRWAMMLMVFLIPLRNIIERMQGLPLGNQFIDILLFSTIVGWWVNSLFRKRPLLEISSINAIAILLILYTFVSFLLGGIYLHGSISLSPHDPRMQDWKNFCILPLFYFVALNNTSQKKDVWMLVGVICMSMFVMDYYTVHQIHWYSNLESRSKITGTFQFLGPNEVAAFFNEYTIILLAIFYSMKKNKYKWPLLGLIS